VEPPPESNRWRRARNGTEMARAVRVTLCRTRPPVAPARAMGEARPGRHQQHRWQAAEGGAAAARRARYVPALRRRAVQGRSSWIDVPPYAARCRFVRRLSVHNGRKRQGVTRSLPLLIYSALGGLRQDPGRAAESPTEARTCGNQGFAKYVCFVGRMGRAERRTDGGTRRALRALGAKVRGARRRTTRSSWPKCNLVERGFHD
jgi:hypothetical protein